MDVPPNGRRWEQMMDWVPFLIALLLIAYAAWLIGANR
jgi:hypothetical protein